ncbi:MAG TPA: 50S ribosomal protein L29 [Gammaproteobacteria bacterium]|jgi:large subunit ribosomal protein L29|nr:50S ribosomal protein L29 [Xanthomonadales bacterium]MCB1593573.1 50S ribosomal protein L29 [Xanthomonadales bacterium]HOP22372.1 50S ribosomal protein L29 [Gammaproteobacteria bacterium]HPI95549.1 50S ribosomal protein L29 [Gammaproteobacteria bacterium]HPQ86760.1 50S ribosomal protein L29 [Gammaproteobacteria bacterium]
MNVKELKGKSLVELKEKLAEIQKHQFDLRMAKGNGQLTKNHLLKEARRDIAKVKTLIKQNLIATKEAGNK